MLQEYYGGRKAIRTYLLTGKFVNIRLPPLDRLPVAEGKRKAIRAYLQTGKFVNIRLPPLHRLQEGQRKDIPAPRPRPNNQQKKANYRRRLDREVREAVRTGQTQTSRTTKLFKEGLEKEAQKQAGQGVFSSSGQGVSESASSRADPGSHWWGNHGWQNRADRDAWNWHR